MYNALDARFYFPLAQDYQHATDSAKNAGFRENKEFYQSKADGIVSALFMFGLGETHEEVQQRLSMIAKRPPLEHHIEVVQRYFRILGLITSGMQEAGLEARRQKMYKK